MRAPPFVSQTSIGYLLSSWVEGMVRVEGKVRHRHRGVQ